MKNILLIFGLLILISCGNGDEHKVIPNFQEQKLSFLPLRFGYDKSNKWIKQPKNILMLHETFKKVGYKNLIQQEEWENDWISWLDVNKSPKNFIDSLEITYSSSKEAPKYYQEFWQRRMNEGNDEVVYQVVSEIKQIFMADKSIAFNPTAVNDTLFNLMGYEFPERALSDQASNQLLQYLIEIGLHESAYNLISGEREKFRDTKWEKAEKEIINLLKESTAKHRPWFEDDTK